MNGSEEVEEWIEVKMTSLLDISTQGIQISHKGNVCQRPVRRRRRRIGEIMSARIVANHWIVTVAVATLIF